MDIMEIVLLAVGGIVFLVSFFIPDRKEASGENKKLAEDEMKKLVNQELESIKGHVDDVVEEAVAYAIEKTERSLERLSNEKIMAVSEYSDTVLAEIHKNHEEAMFLYDMLNNKHTNIKNTVSEINRTMKEAEEKVSSFQKLVPEALKIGREEELSLEMEEKTFGNRALEGKRSSIGNTVGNRSSVGNIEEQNVSGRVSVQERQGTIFGEAEIGESADQFKRLGEHGLLQMEEENSFQDNNNDRILELYRNGKSAVEIAKELELGMGEVNLVIDLFKA